jgi:hypothetical protein
VDVETGQKMHHLRPGADVLPVFSPHSKKVMWASTRDGRGPAQLSSNDQLPRPVAPERRGRADYAPPPFNSFL